MTSTVSTGKNLNDLSQDPYNSPRSLNVSMKDSYLPVPPVVTPAVQSDESQALQKILDVKSMVSRIENMSDSVKREVYVKLQEAETVIHTHIGYRAVKLHRIKERMQTK